MRPLPRTAAATLVLLLDAGHAADIDIVSSAWRNNATVHEPTGMPAARAEPPAGVRVHTLDLSFAVLGWSAFLKNGEALRGRFGDRVGFHP